jgi:hypothetical protein
MQGLRRTMLLLTCAALLPGCETGRGDLYIVPASQTPAGYLPGECRYVLKFEQNGQEFTPNHMIVPAYQDRIYIVCRKKKHPLDSNLHLQASSYRQEISGKLARRIAL